ncbi:MAG: helix-turn-helix domain-containing protein [Lachnospirales bacterium]
MEDDINVGKKVKEYRNIKKLSIKKLSELTGITSSMISQIEKNQVNPSINTIKNIANALEIPLFYFFQEDIPSASIIVRSDERKIIGIPSNRDVTYELLTSDIQGEIEFCLMTLPAKTDTGNEYQSHIGEEVAYVVSGEVEISIANSDLTLLKAGDSLRLRPQTKHKWFNNSNFQTQVIFAITPPSF